MFECSLYGTLNNIIKLNETLLYLRYKRNDRKRKLIIYKKDYTKIFLEDGYVTIKERPDTNKSRLSICQKIARQKIYGDIFEDLGYVKSDVAIDTSEYFYENNCFEISKEDNYFIVKLYILTNSPNDGEKILESVKEAFKNVLELKKPPISWFLK